jgi:hypothetical protein
MALVVPLCLVLMLVVLSLLDARLKEKLTRLFDTAGAARRQVRAVVVDKAMTLGRKQIAGSVPVVLVINQPDMGSLKVRLDAGDEHWVRVGQPAYAATGVGDDVIVDICRGRFTRRLYVLRLRAQKA